MYPSVDEIIATRRRSRLPPIACSTNMPQQLRRQLPGLLMPRAHPRAQGGVWDWVTRIQDHLTVQIFLPWRDFDSPTSGNFCCNGLVLADRTVTPKTRS
jgi:hypothetical protein